MEALAQTSVNQDARERIIWGEGAEVFFAQIERRLNLTTAATATVKSWIEACCHLLTHESHHNITWAGQLSLVNALLALGHRNDALDLLRADHTPSSWACDFCNQRKDVQASYHAIKAGESVGYCELCFQMACAKCMPLIHTDEYTRFCVPGHRMLEVKLGGPLVFRGVQMEKAKCAEILRGGVWNT